MAGIALALVAFPKLALAQGKKVALPLKSAEKLNTVGGFMITKVKDKDLLLIRDTETTVKAFDSMCTHEKCGLTYDAGKKQVKCPCHNAYFDLTGKVVSGPPPKPVASYPATLSGDKVVITL
jgi:Rieske Fe-S protein